MGTNFYWISDDKYADEYDIHIHIGKRSAAGSYCYDCGTTLNSEGTSEIHTGSNQLSQWLDECPACNTLKGAGNVKTCCSFTWTLLKHKWEIKRLAKEEPDKKIIYNEYDEKFTAKEFLEEELKTCMVEYQTPREFS
jgi:hypothetical protein